MKNLNFRWGVCVNSTQVSTPMIVTPTGREVNNEVSLMTREVDYIENIDFCAKLINLYIQKQIDFVI